MTTATPPEPKAPVRERGAGEESIFRVASQIFRERGYHATSMRAISSALGMQPAALYYYYPGKENLLFRIMESAIDALTARVIEAVNPADPAPQRLRQAIDAHVTAVADHLDELGVFFQELRALSPKSRELIQAKRDRYERIFRDILQDGVDSGELTKVDPRLAGFVILAACNWLYSWFKPDGAYRPEEIATAFGDMLLHGLLP